MQQSYFLYEQLADPRSDQVRARLQTKKQKNPLFNPTIPPATQRSALDNAGNKIKPLMGQQIEPVQAGEVSGEWVRVNAQCSSRQVMFYLHGGAFFTRSGLGSPLLASRGGIARCTASQREPSHCYPLTIPLNCTRLVL